ncbi:MAG: hypothetical protein GQ539_13355 [Sulfitobacter sp.]|jgi:hypothetical protein|nr:hypothetical protein [Sulfitobacter sp.]
MSLLGRLVYKTRKFYDDDFDWNTYTADSYARRIKTDVEPKFVANAQDGQLSFDPATGAVTAQNGTIHPNPLLIFETIGKLQPKSVHEVGCGGGDHVANGKKLFPAIRFSGGDRGQTQLDMAAQRHPELASSLSLQDITMPFSHHWPRAELVYSQAVLMHIHTAVSHFVALTSMVNSADRFVLLVENIQCHNFVADIKALHEGGHFNWPEMNMYLVVGSTGARGILLSKEKQDLPLLTSDAQLREGAKYSKRRITRANEDSARATFGPAKAR